MLVRIGDGHRGGHRHNVCAGTGSTVGSSSSSANNSLTAPARCLSRALGALAWSLAARARLWRSGRCNVRVGRNSDPAREGHGTRTRDRRRHKGDGRARRDAGGSRGGQAHERKGLDLCEDLPIERGDVQRRRRGGLHKRCRRQRRWYESGHGVRGAHHGQGRRQ